MHKTARILNRDNGLIYHTEEKILGGLDPNKAKRPCEKNPSRCQTEMRASCAKTNCNCVKEK